MTLNQILYFRKVARLENYHQAAEELYISQPSLSRSMAALESELESRCLKRKGAVLSLPMPAVFSWSMQTGSQATVTLRQAR